MSYIEFDAKYRTFTIMDQQHRQFIDILNRFFDDWIKDRKLDPHPYLMEVADYGQYHFDAEEQYMEENKITNLEEHKKVHKELMISLANLIRRIESGEEITMETFQFLQGWLMNHVVGMDKRNYGL